MSKKIIAGPWLGEFGWELMRWQGIFRKLAHKGYEITMVSRLGHEALYKDYVKEFIPAIDLGFNEQGATDGWRIDGKVPTIDRLVLESKFPGYKYMDATTCMKIGQDPLGKGQAFIKYGKEFNTEKAELERNAWGDFRYDLLIHARWTDKGGTNIRNWPRDKWEELIWKLGEQGKLDGSKRYHMAVIGSPEGAMHFSGLGGCCDYRGAALTQVIEMIANSRLVVGPSSGPMHLASLCGTPHLVWTDKNFWGSCNGTNRERYEKNWNPKGTKAILLDEEGWQPSVDTVLTAIKGHLDG